MAIIRLDPLTRSLFRPWSEDEDWLGFTNDDDLTAYETENSFVVKANVAGVPAEDVDVTVDRGVVTIKAEHKESTEEKKKKKVIYKEGRLAKYLYTTSIPCPVQANKAKAEVENGVVTITIPKSAEAKPKRIKVKAKGK